MDTLISPRTEAAKCLVVLSHLKNKKIAQYSQSTLQVMNVIFFPCPRLDCFTSVSTAQCYYMLWCNLSCVRNNKIYWNVPSFSYRTMQYAVTTWCAELSKSLSLKLLVHLPCSSELWWCDFISRVKESLCRCQFADADAINKDFTASLHYLSR